MAACEAGSYSGAGASACTACEEGRYTGDAAQSSCALSTGGFYVATTGATAPSECSAGRYSGSGSTFCSLCSEGTTSDAGAATCTTADAGYIAPTAERYRITLASSVVFDGIDAAAVDAYLGAQTDAAFAAFFEESIIDAGFSDIIDSATVRSVGPAVDVVENVAELYFSVVANYSASAAENISTVAAFVESDFEDALSLLVYNGEYQAFVDANFDADLTIDEDRNLAAIAATMTTYDRVTNSTFAGPRPARK